MITIHQALPKEFGVIQQIAYETWPVCYGEILYKSQLDYMLGKFYTLEALHENAKDGHQFILIREHETPLGFAALEHDYKNTNLTRIHKIYILPNTQGKGLGKLLIKKIDDLAHDHGSIGLSLNVNRYNIAQHFYKKLGFEITKEEDIEIGEGWLMEDYVMEKLF